MAEGGQGGNPLPAAAALAPGTADSMSGSASSQRRTSFGRAPCAARLPRPSFRVGPADLGLQASPPGGSSASNAPRSWRALRYCASCAGKSGCTSSARARTRGEHKQGGCVSAGGWWPGQTSGALKGVREGGGAFRDSVCKEQAVAACVLPAPPGSPAARGIECQQASSRAPFCPPAFFRAQRKVQSH